MLEQELRGVPRSPGVRQWEQTPSILTVDFKLVENTRLEAAVDAVDDVVHLHEPLDLRLVPSRALRFPELQLDNRLVRTVVVTADESRRPSLQPVDAIDVLKRVSESDHVKLVGQDGVMDARPLDVVQRRLLSRRAADCLVFFRLLRLVHPGLGDVLRLILVVLQR